MGVPRLEAPRARRAAHPVFRGPVHPGHRGPPSPPWRGVAALAAPHDPPLSPHLGSARSALLAVQGASPHPRMGRTLRAAARARAVRCRAALADAAGLAPGAAGERLLG
eukprot:6282729-Lingulodinium_polyedra.AAC.1